MNTIELKAPYLIFTGSETELTYAKTGAGLVQWRPELCKAQLNLGNNGVDLGLPHMTIEQARDAGIRSLIIGTAAVGGGIPEDWLDTLEKAALMGLDIVAGTHVRLTDIPRLVTAATTSGATLVDIRIPPKNLPVGTGRKRTGKRLLMVGTDCAVGKKYSALQMEKDLLAQGIDADFRATGQTGIMIAGEGIPIDSVVSDFLSGAAEVVSPDNRVDHWDVIEGQGGMFHPGYAAVIIGLLLGSQPDAFVVCHEAGRKCIDGWEDFPIPSIDSVIQRTIAVGQLTNPDIRCVGVCVNTSSLSSAERSEYLQKQSRILGVPCVDPLIEGTGKIIERLLQTDTK